MKQVALRVFFFIFIFFIFNSAFSQIDSMMQVYANDLPQQKIYVHFDKGIYRAGETIWFKAYLFAGYQPALNSKNLFAELIDEGGNVIQRKVYPLIESSAGGNFDIPENAGAAKLTFRAYTTWMLNFDTAFIFQRNIDVVNKIGSMPFVAKSSIPPAVTLRFFAEGGNLVNDLESNIAFKANDEHGMPVYVGGNIRNAKNEVVANFNSQHDGMGVFKFTPEHQQTYTAYWKDAKGQEHTTPLPAAKAEGIVLNVTSAGKKKVFIIKRSDDPLMAYQNVMIEAHLAGELVYKAKVPLVKSFLNSGSIDVEDLPAGVLQVTVFSTDWKPLAERITMINNHNYMFDISVQADTTDTNIRAKNVFEIKTSDTSLSNISISVTDADISAKANTDNIISGLLLSGDIKGYVHNPAYYFSNNTDSVAGHLDLVMLTHGWRRYNWGDIADKKRPLLKFPAEQYLSLNAKAFGVHPSRPLRKDEALTAVVVTRDSTNQIMEIPKVSIDSFSTGNMIFFDTVTVHYQFAKDRRMEQRVTMKFDNGLYKGVKKIDAAQIPYAGTSDKDTTSINRTKELAGQLIKFKDTWVGKGNVLQAVTVKTRPKSRVDILDEKYANGFFTGGDAYSFDLTNEPLMMSITSYLQARVPGITIRNDGSDISITWRNSETAVFIDEIPVSADNLLGLNVAEIAYVKVFRPPFFGSVGGGSGGAISIYLRKGGDVPPPPGKGLSATQVAGYSYAKEFYSPDYTTRSASSDVMADYRSTLYWNPYIFMDGTRQSVKVRFFNNDITKAFRVILEGVNEAGKLVRIEKIVQ